MEFLLNQQARFDAEMYELKAAQAASEKKLDRTTEMLSSYATLLYKSFAITDDRFRELADSQKLTDVKIRELTDSQKLTDAELRKFIAKVDRLTGEGQNGLQN